MTVVHNAVVTGDRRVVINEVGLRDGLQNFPVILPTDAKLDLYTALRRAGLRRFELTSFVNPKTVPALADAADFVARVPRDETLLTALVPNRKGYDRARAAGLRSVAVVLAATETLNQKNIRMSLPVAAAECAAVCRAAKDDGVHVRAYVAAACACPYEGITDVSRVMELAAAMLEAGAHEIALADTIGAGHPAQVETLFGAAVAQFGAARLAAHFHDTRAMALTLSWIALRAGVRRFDASIGGLGGCPFAPGASGNLATEDLAFMLEQSGFETGLSVDGLMAAADVAGRLLGASVGGKIAPWYAAQQRRVGARSVH